MTFLHFMKSFDPVNFERISKGLHTPLSKDRRDYYTLRVRRYGKRTELDYDRRWKWTNGTISSWKTEK